MSIPFAFGILVLLAVASESPGAALALGLSAFTAAIAVRYVASS